MKRHAYCIIAHNDPYCLEKLISLIDDERNDIFLIFDKKSNLIESFKPNTKYSNIFKPHDSKLIDIRWGGTSLMQAELLALSLAVDKGEYDYIHLLSGVDLPIKTQDYIHDFFDNLTPGTNCINFSNKRHTEEAFNANCRYYQLFTDKARSKNILERKTYSFLRQTYIKLQKVFNIQRNWDGWTFGKGTNWVSITYSFAKYLIDNKKTIFKQFRGVHCVDEIWKHTVMLTSPYKDTAAHFEDVSDCVRRIDWNRGTPYVWRMEDYDELVSSKELFARKFSSDTDMEIIDKIYNYVKNKNKQ